MIEHLWPFLSFFFATLIATVIVETLLNARWSPHYFSKGISIYHHTVTMPPNIGMTPTAEAIESNLPDSGWYPPILVRKIGENQFAFREKMIHFGIGYTPLMHGCLMCDPYSGRIEIRGYANWFPMIFSCYFLMLSLSMPLDSLGVIFPLFLFGLFWFIYSIQRKRFEQVAAAVQKMWERGRTNG